MRQEGRIWLCNDPTKLKLILKKALIWMIVLELVHHRREANMDHALFVKAKSHLHGIAVLQVWVGSSRRRRRCSVRIAAFNGGTVSMICEACLLY